MTQEDELQETPESFDDAFNEATEQGEDLDEPANLTASLGQRLQGEYERRRAQRSEIEKRWLRNIRQYNGLYEPEFEAALKERKFNSKVFVPITRRICNIVEARLGDLLFPSDDRNFAVNTSPDPETEEASEALEKADPATPVNAAGVSSTAGEMKKNISDVIAEAKRKAANMQRTVDDQLAESDWPSESRRVMHDGIKLGTGVAKGPFVLSKTKKKWITEGGATKLVIKNEFKPVIKRVDPWNFYPQLGAANVKDSESFYERHPMNKLEFMQLAEQPGFDREAIERVLTSGSSQNRDTNTDAQRESAGTVGVDDERFYVVEYNGPVDAQDLEACGCKLPEDKLLVYGAVVWFSEYTGEVIKAIIHPLDTGNCMYSVFNWQPDSVSIFGYGLPHEIQDIQESANSSFRGAQDNLALSVGPQVVVNSKKITPMNGSWAIEPNKVWDLNDASVPVQSVFGFFQIDSRVQELMEFFNLTKQLADEIGGPMLAMQGTDSPNYTNTATGMSIAYNSANIWMRRAVKLWDDQVTVPRVQAFVDWNMQYNPKDDIKGDWNVIARGTSALLEAEGQVARLQVLQEASAKAGIPMKNQVAQLRQMCLAMRMDPDEQLPSDSEVEQLMANQQQPPNPEIERIRIRDAELADRQEQRAHENMLDERNSQLRVAELASRENMTAEDARRKYGIDVMKIESNERVTNRKIDSENKRFNAEAVIKAQQGSGL